MCSTGSETQKEVNEPITNCKRLKLVVEDANLRLVIDR